MGGRMFATLFYSREIFLHSFLCGRLLLRSRSVPIIRIVNSRVPRIPTAPKRVAIVVVVLMVVPVRRLLVILTATVPAVFVRRRRRCQHHGYGHAPTAPGQTRSGKRFAEKVPPSQFPWPGNLTSQSAREISRLHKKTSCLHVVSGLACVGHKSLRICAQCRLASPQKGSVNLTGVRAT